MRLSPGMVRTVALCAALGVGVAVPPLAAGKDWLRPLIMVLLGLAFLELPLRRPQGLGVVAALLGASWALAAITWAVLAPFDRELAIAGALIAATPPAIASPVLVGMLGGDVGFAAAAVLIGNVIAAIVLPTALSLMGATPGLQTMQVLAPVLLTVGVPLACVILLKLCAPRLAEGLKPLRAAAFPLWCLGLTVVAAAAAVALRADNGVSHGRMLGVAITAVVLCAACFLGGRLIGGRRFAVEGGQAMGQKNTILTIWIGLVFCTPLVALGPTCYVFCHNLVNAWQLSRRRPPLQAD